jgi:glycerophosphoryl diester phosphodiesterase
MFDDLPRPLLMAHRGASAYAPENTHEAFDLALRVGAQVLEMDVRMSRDGEVIVIHDEDLARTTNRQGRVSGLTYAELSKLDAGFHFRRAGELVFRGRGVVIPRFVDILQSFPRAGFNIDIKQRHPPMVDAVLEALEQVSPTRVLLTSSDDTVMRNIEERAPHCALGMSRGRVKEVIKAVYLGGMPACFAGRGLQLPLRHPRFAFGILPLVTRRVVRLVQAAGMEVHLWVINSPHAARYWLEQGVDGVFTDDPSDMHEVFRAFWENAVTNMASRRV